MIAERELLAEAEALLAARQLLEAIQCFQQAEAAAADPDCCAAGRWMAYMLLGQFESAWQQSDAIRRRLAPDPNRLWQGEPLAGKRIMLRCLHGFGDAVQFLRYVPRLRAVAASVIIDLVDEIVPIHQGRIWQSGTAVHRIPLLRTAIPTLPSAVGAPA